MRVLLWHGWLLEGAGSNVYTARVAEELVRVRPRRRAPVPGGAPRGRTRGSTGWGTVDGDGPHDLTPVATDRGLPGRCTLLRPSIGSLLPVFVLDEYEGFQVKTFLDLTDDELQHYLNANASALRAAVAWHGSEVVITGHAVPGGEIGRRALGPGRFITKIHGSDMEYAMRPQERYLELASIGLGAARAVTGSSADAIERCVEMVPEVADRVRVVPPGVDVERFHPAPRRAALLETADRLDADAEPGGRPSSLDAEVERALAARDAEALDGLAAAYDQTAPDPQAAERLRALAEHEGDLVGYLGKLIPQKGVDLLLAGVRSSARRPITLVVGFGLYREWLVALGQALEEGSTDAIEWLVAAGRVGPDVLDAPASAVPTIFTGRLDHRFAPGALAAMDVLVVPSILDEAFGMVAAEGAAAGALPLVARHSGLAEVATALEAATGRPGLFSFEPGPGAARRLGQGLDRLLALPPTSVRSSAPRVRAFVAREWSWHRTAERLLDAAAG